jgi:RND superfamily putative drug exporter
VKTVVAVRDLGRSADQQAEQLQVLSNVGGGDETGVTNLVKDLRAQIAKAGAPAGLQVHLAGQLAISVDQQTKSGSTGNQVEGLSVIFILVLLLLIFRSLLAPLITLIPAFLAVAISGWPARSRCSPWSAAGARAATRSATSGWGWRSAC